MRNLSLVELNRATLARQLLLRRDRLSVTRAVARVGALQAQWPPSPYLALHARLDGFTRPQLARAIQRRTVVKATLMRTTLHHVTAEDYLACAGILRRRRIAAVARELANHSVDVDVDVDELARRAAELTAQEPRTRPELLHLLDRPGLDPAERGPWLVWHLLVARAELVHGPSSSAWRLNTGGGTFVPATTWLGGSGADGAQAAAHLVRRYLLAFGPATQADAARWTGLPASELEPGFERLRLRQFRDESGRELLDLPRAPLPPADTPAPPRLLPRWDSVLLAHDDRRRVLPDEVRGGVISRNGDVAATILVDGVVAGTWELRAGRVTLEPFAPLPTPVRRELDEEARRVEAFVANG